MSLPAAWVDALFDKLTLTYGQAFLRRWQDVDLNAVKTDWSHELAGFAHHPEAIAWALQNLPTDQAPTVLQFRAIARRAPMPDVPRIEVAPADPSRVAAELRKLAPIAGRPYTGRDGKQWARDLLARVAAGGQKPSRTVLKMAQDAVAERSIFPGASA
ncbi:hypothetical protein NF681_11325 [Comamonadaceae bacterium OTU4NAUVB1]|nr:hypothetical protein NF681_11325 [Comamonadaceae bacterium OTU4NAUVB1]